MADEPIKLTIQDTPDKLRPLAEEAAAFLAGVLRELAEAENRSFAQYTRLCKKGRVVEFRDGVREEITDTQVWGARSKARFAALLDPYCTKKHIAQRRECLHSTHFPSSFNCVRTGCELAVAVKSAKKAEVRVIPAEGSVPFDLRDADVRYLVEDARGSGHAAQYYSYFQKFRFILRREGEGWRIDEVYSAAASQDRYRRDFYF
jgi:hypothetical protein